MSIGLTFARLSGVTSFIGIFATANAHETISRLSSTTMIRLCVFLLENVAVAEDPGSLILSVLMTMPTVPAM